MGVKFNNMQRKLDEKRADLKRVSTKMHDHLWEKAEARRQKERLRMRKLKSKGQWKGLGVSYHSTRTIRIHRNAAMKIQLAYRRHLQQRYMEATMEARLHSIAMIDAMLDGSRASERSEFQLKRLVQRDAEWREIEIASRDVASRRKTFGRLEEEAQLDRVVAECARGAARQAQVRARPLVR